MTEPDPKTAGAIVGDSPAVARTRSRRGRAAATTSPLAGARRDVLVVLLIPSVERDGRTPVDQAHWVYEALAMFGRVYGRAIAMGPLLRVWRDDEHRGAHVIDHPVAIHCYTTRSEIRDEYKLARLGGFCRRLGYETRQGEVSLVIDNHYFAITDFEDAR